MRLTPQQLEQRRFRAIEALKRGLSQKEVAELLATSVASVSQWNRRFNSGGHEQLSARPQGRPRRGQARNGALDQVVATLLSRRPEQVGLGKGLWEWRAVQRLIRQTTGSDMSRWTVLRYLSEWGLDAPDVFPADRSGPGSAGPARLEAVWSSVQAEARRLRAALFLIESTRLASDRQTAGPPGGERRVIWSVRPRGDSAFLVCPAPLVGQDVIDFFERILKASPSRILAVLLDEKLCNDSAVGAWLRTRQDVIIVWPLRQIHPSVADASAPEGAMPFVLRK
jgi:transposase